MNAGAVYVFQRTNGTWVQQAYIKASNTQATDEFGWGVSVFGDTLLVGSRQESNSATGVDGNQTAGGASASGAAYVFERVDNMVPARLSQGIEYARGCAIRCVGSGLGRHDRRRRFGCRRLRPH